VLNRLATIAALLVAAHTIVFIVHYTSPTPFWDFWDWLSDFHTYTQGHYTLRDLFKPHNEHRIVTTRVLLFADALWFHLTGWFVLAINLICLAATGALLAWAGRTPASLAARATLPVLIYVAWMWSTCQWFNLILPFEVQHALMCVFIVAAALLLVPATDPASRHKLVWAALAAAAFFLALFSVAGGLLALPWLLILLVLRRSPLRPAGVFIVLAIAAAALFLWDYHAQHPPRVDFGMHHVAGTLLCFACAYLGSAFYAFRGVPLIAGAIAMTLFAIATAIIAQRTLRGKPPPGRSLALYAICGTFVLTAAAAAVARGAAGPAAALEPRYATVSLTFWAALSALTAELILCGTAIATRRVMIFTRPLLVAAIGGIAACNFATRYAKDAESLNSGLASQAEATRQNVTAPTLFSGWYYGREPGIDRALLQARRLAMFAPSVQPWPALAAATSLSRAAPRSICHAAIDTAERLDATRFLFRGWAVSADNKRVADAITLLAPDDTVAAVLPATQWRTDIPRGRHRKYRSRGVFTGFAYPLAGTGALALRGVALFQGRPDKTCALPELIRIAALPAGAKPDAARLY
jgi:hypothetical protein